MTSKELLYVEDALGHEKFFQTKCQEVKSCLQDAELKKHVEKIEQHHKHTFESFLNLL